jgi:hypothetical protein
MIDYVRYRLHLAKLFRQRTSTTDFFHRKISKAKKEGKPRVYLSELDAEAYFERRMVNEDISILVTDYLIRQANLSFLPVPAHSENGMWEQCEFDSGRFVLTAAGISKLRTSVRSEKKERNEMVIKTLAAITGIIGTATGLLAVWLKK